MSKGREYSVIAAITLTIYTVSLICFMLILTQENALTKVMLLVGIFIALQFLLLLGLISCSNWARIYGVIFYTGLFGGEIYFLFFHPISNFSIWGKLIVMIGSIAFYGYIIGSLLSQEMKNLFLSKD